MTLITRSNKSTSNQKHFTVKDIFYGFTAEEKSKWFVSTPGLVVFDTSGTINYNYLQLDDSTTPNTFNRLYYSITAMEGERRYLHIDRATPFSLSISSESPILSSSISSQLSTATSTGQPAERLFISTLDSVIASWSYDESIDQPLVPALPVGSGIVSTLVRSAIYAQTPLHKLYPATNTIWDDQLVSGINDFDKYEYYRGDIYIFDRYFRLNSDGTDLHNEDDMTNPYTLEIHKALQAGKFSKNELNINDDRYTTLGYYIEKTASLLGHRLDANGEIDKQREKALTRNILSPTSKPDPKKHGGSSFGHESLLVRRLNNHFNNDKIEDGGVVSVPDLPQLMLEVLDQLNLGLGIQESSAIEIKHDGQTHRYPNLLALVTEIAIHQFNQSQYSKSTHISSLVTQQQTNEIIGGLGLPTVSKQIIRTVNGKNAAIPYWGIAPQASLAKKIDTCTYNVGLVLGQVT
jgi:hypothetical protein